METRVEREPKALETVKQEIDRILVDARELGGGQPHISELTTLPAYKQLDSSQQKEAHVYASSQGFLMEALGVGMKTVGNETGNKRDARRHGPTERANQVDAVVGMIDAMVGSGLPVEVEDSPQFQALPPEGRNAVRAYAREKGLKVAADEVVPAAPEREVVAEPSRAEPVAAVPLKGNVEAIDREVTQGKGAVGHVDGGREADAEKAAGPETEAKPTPEKRGRYKEFTGYGFYDGKDERGRPRMQVVEHFMETDDNGHDEDKSRPVRGFYLPGGMFKLMREDADYRVHAGAELTSARKEIDENGGLNFNLEWNDDHTQFEPIWTYTLNGEEKVDRLKADDLPEGFVRAIEEKKQELSRDPRYIKALEEKGAEFLQDEGYQDAFEEKGRELRQNPRYGRWYVGAMMDKRNEILADELVRRMRYEEPKRAETDADEPAVAAAGDADLSAAREVTLEGTTPGEFRVTGKEKAAESKPATAPAEAGATTTAAEAAPAAAEAMPAAPKPDKPSAEKLLWEKFGSADKVAGLAEIRAGVAEIAARFTHLVRTPEDLKGVLDIAMVMAVDGLKTQAEKAGRTYDVRNDEVVRLLLQQQLESKSGVLAPKEADAPARKATVPKPTPVAAPDESAAELPPEILTEDEARFFAASPALSGVTGVRVSVRGEGKNPRSMVSVGLEKGRENEGVERLVRAAVSDAMDGMPDPLFKIGSAVSDFLVSYVTGDERETPAGKRLRAEVVDVERGEAVIRDYRRLVEVVKKVAAEMKV